MRRALVPAALAPVLLATAAPPAPAQQAGVGADALLAQLRSCHQVSRGKYRTDDGAKAAVPVCSARGAVFWKADLDIDCDGRPSRACNRRTDPYFQPTTAFQQSDGKHLSSASLPFVVVPGASRIWNHAKAGVGAGSVAAIIYRGRVQYAVVGDTGPTDLIGEASHAAARGLGIDPHPVRGGAPGGVTYLVFPHSRARPIESHGAAVRAGEALARRFVGGE